MSSLTQHNAALKASECLTQLRSQVPESQHKALQQVETLYNKKWVFAFAVASHILICGPPRRLFAHRLYHQLTNAIIELAHQQEFAPILIPLYRNFITQFETNLNALRLVEIAALAASQFPRS